MGVVCWEACLAPDWFQQRLLLTCRAHTWGQRKSEREGGREGGTELLLTECAWGEVEVREEIYRERGLRVLLLEEHLIYLQGNTPE